MIAIADYLSTKPLTKSRSNLIGFHVEYFHAMTVLYGVISYKRGLGKVNDWR